MKKLLALTSLFWLVSVCWSQTWLPMGTRVIDYPDSVVFAGGGTGMSISQAITAVRTNGTIYLWPGTYTEGSLTNTKALTIKGIGGRSDVIIDPTTTFLNTSANVKWEGITFNVDFLPADSAFGTSSNATMRFTDCDLNLRWVSFYDSVWFENSELSPVSADSFIIKNWFDMQNCEQNGYELSLNRGAGGALTGAGGRIVNSRGYSTVGDNINIEGVLASPYNVQIIQSNFITTKQRSLSAYGVGNLTLLSSNFTNNDDDSSAVVVRDSCEAVIIGCGFNNLNARTMANERDDALVITNADTIKFGGNWGYGNCLIDTSTETLAAKPRLRIVGENNFDGMALFDGVVGTEINQWVIGPRTDRFMFNEMFYTDTDSGGLTTCALDSAVVLHLMDKEGKSTGYLSAYGRLDLKTPTAWISVGDTTGSNQRVNKSKIKRIKVFRDAFNGNAARDSIFAKGASQSADFFLYTPLSTAAPSANDMATVAPGAAGDTIFVTRSASGTAGLQYALMWIQFTNAAASDTI